MGQHTRHAEESAATVAVLMEESLVVRDLMSEEEERSVIEVLVDILEPFQQATEAMRAISTQNSEL